MDDVLVARWPEEEAKWSDAVRRGRPCLLLVADDAPAPVHTDPLTDWARVSTPEADLEARLSALRGRDAGENGTLVVRDGVATRRGRSMALSPIECILTETLARREGKVVHRDQLLRQAWPPDARRDRGRLDAAIRRLRRRLEPIGLRIVTVRARGYMLEPIDDAPLSDSRQEHVSNA